MSQLFTSGGQSIRASTSASILPVNIQSWFPLGFTGLTSLLPKGFSTVFSNTTVQKRQFFSILTSLWSSSHNHQFSSVQLLTRVWFFVTPWTTARQASLSIANSRSLLKFMSIELVMIYNYLIFCHLLFLLPSIFPSISIFSNELALSIRRPKLWNFSFSNSPSNEYSGLISFRIDWFDLFAVQGTQESSPAP